MTTGRVYSRNDCRLERSMTQRAKTTKPSEEAHRAPLARALRVQRRRQRVRWWGTVLLVLTLGLAGGYGASEALGVYAEWKAMRSEMLALRGLLLGDHTQSFTDEYNRRLAEAKTAETETAETEAEE